MAYIAGGLIFSVFVLALLRIWGWDMVKDVLLSPVRRCDFDDEWCVVCGDVAVGSCENCGAHICVNHEAGEYDDVYTCADRSACSARIEAIRKAIPLNGKAPHE